MDRIKNFRYDRPTLGVLAGWQFYRTATNLSYLAPVYQGISRACLDQGCNLLLGCGIGPSASPTDPLRPAWPFRSLEQDFVPIGPWNTDGLIIANPLHSATRSTYVQELISNGHPVLFIGSGEVGPTIVADNQGGILEAVRHLINHGHREIAFIAGTLEDMGGDTGDRLRAFQSACEIYDLDQDPNLVAFGRHVFDGGYAAMQKILSSGASFTAVLASNDESALGVMQALEEAGRKIPGDVAVIGFDNRLEGAIHDPGLSSIHVPLFDIGYQAVERLLRCIEGKEELTGIFTVDTRLIVRESCGCGSRKSAFIETEPLNPAKSFSTDDRPSHLVNSIATAIMNQAYHLTNEECLFHSQRLVEAFTSALKLHNPADFYKTFTEILQHTAASHDNVHIWQEALTLLEIGMSEVSTHRTPLNPPANDILTWARLTVSAQMQRQYQQYVVDERWTSSRLSLLTARLLTALDEDQIYTILARHLPDMDIQLALVALLEGEGDEPAAWCTVRDAIHVDQPPLRIPAREFPPSGLLDPEKPFILTLIPLIEPSGQTGFMAFGTEHFDLFGAIVQQLGGALNTARLYRQAMEGRRLAEEANRMKSRFLSTISHELRTPLSLILGLSGMLLEESEEGKSPLPDPIQKDVERIHAYAQHLGGLIGDVLDLTTSEAGQLRLNMELVDLGVTLHMVAESGSQLAADKGLTWRANIPESGPWVWGDRTRLRQVVLNLVNNAIKFTTRGEVCLNLETGSDSVTISVKDTGVGILPEEQERVFDEFCQTEKTISLGYPGLGLGLAICKTLVEIHQGTIGVRSTGKEGEGSTFYVTLPTVEPPVVQIQESSTKQTNQPSVLVFINRAGAAERLCDQLKLRGFNVQTALMDRHFDWRTPLENLSPSAIVVDVSSDSELGWNTLKAIKSSPFAKGIPAMFYSSSSEGESWFDLDYLTKPIELAELKQALDQYWLVADPSHPVRTFLVVDDDPNTLDMHARIIQSQSSSYRVLKAHNGREALEILDHDQVDLVLLDLQMPEMDGFTVLEKMRDFESKRDIPVIVVTGKELTESDMDQLNQGVAVILKKGLFSIDETIDHIAAALEHRHRLSMDAQRLIRLAMAYIHEFYAEQITRRDIARHINIAEDYLTFCFRQELGITPIKYLQRYRVNQAKRLLKDSQKTITEIALAVGFSDSSYFSRIFHREVGLAPEAYRAS